MLYGAERAVGDERGHVQRAVGTDLGTLGKLDFHGGGSQNNATLDTTIDTALTGTAATRCKADSTPIPTPPATGRGIEPSGVCRQGWNGTWSESGRLPSIPKCERRPCPPAQLARRSHRHDSQFSERRVQHILHELRQRSQELLYAGGRPNAATPAASMRKSAPDIENIDVLRHRRSCRAERTVDPLL